MSARTGEFEVCRRIANPSEGAALLSLAAAVSLTVESCTMGA